MSLLNYTTYDDIRAALGVTDEELEDDVLGLQLYEDNLRFELDDVHPDLATLHTTLESTPVLTSAQERFMAACRGFATYAVARSLTSTLPMFGPKSIEDGKARMERFADPYKATIEAVNKSYATWKARLEAAYGTLMSTSKPTVFMSYAVSATPTYNPITGT